MCENLNCKTLNRSDLSFECNPAKRNLVHKHTQVKFRYAECKDELTSLADKATQDAGTVTVKCCV